MAQKIHRKEEVVQYKYKNYSNRKQKKPPAKNCERFLLIQHVPKK